jgi:hypothetical protein
MRLYSLDKCMSRCITYKGVDVNRVFLPPTNRPLFINSIASITKSDKNSAALPGFSGPQNAPTTNGSLQLLFLTLQRIGHNDTVLLLNSGSPSMLIWI